MDWQSLSSRFFLLSHPLLRAQVLLRQQHPAEEADPEAAEQSHRQRVQRQGHEHGSNEDRVGFEELLQPAEHECEGLQQEVHWRS